MTQPPSQSANDRDASIRPAEDALQDYMAQLFFAPDTHADVDFAKQARVDVDSAQTPVASPSSMANVDAWHALNGTKDDAALAASTPLMPMPKRPPALQSQAALLMSAGQIPRDVALSDGQKRDLQRLLDQKLLSSATPVDERPLEPPPAPEVPRENCAKAIPDQDSELAPEHVERLEACTHKSTRASLAPEAVYRGHWQHQLPDWAATRFDVLLFSCRGVSLAIPLISLGHIYWQTEPLHQLPGGAPWGLGVKPLHKGGQLKVIDAGAYFMPERSGCLDFDAGLHILALADSDWAFAVDRVANPVAVTPEDVQWRPFSRNNPWLAGAIKHHMCVLIDTPALITLLIR
ncbi:MAG TPA: chemotaxis protein CheW [Marinagarivorans sp.]